MVMDGKKQREGEREAGLNNFESLIFPQSYQSTDSIALEPGTNGDSKSCIHSCEQ